MPLDSDGLVRHTSFMSNWTVWVFRKESGRVPLEKWKVSKKLTDKDKAALDYRVTMIESWSGPQLPPEVLKDYRTTDLKEMKVRGDKKQLRPLCVVDDTRRIVILCGAIEKDKKIPDGDIETGENLREEWLSERGTIERYFKD